MSQKDDGLALAIKVDDFTWQRSVELDGVRFEVSYEFWHDSVQSRPFSEAVQLLREIASMYREEKMNRVP